MKLGKILSSSITAALFSSALLASGHSATHWGYTGHEGPANWGDLDPNYSMCKAGSSQSPIDIKKSITIDTKGLEKIGFNYVTGSETVINNGHTIQVNIKNGSSISVDGIEFSLKQVHFHTPSENHIEGVSFPLEAHFVHASSDGKLAVVALMLEDGKENEVINSIWNKMPHHAGESEAIDLSAKVINSLLPEDKSYYRFSGSLTTPPCSEGVRWLVLKNYSHISAHQVEEFLHILHHANNRPIQPANARKVID